MTPEHSRLADKFETLLAENQATKAALEVANLQISALKELVCLPVSALEIRDRAFKLLWPTEKKEGV